MSMIDDFDISVTPEAAAEYRNAADRNLTAPSVEENPTFRQGKQPGLGTWTELVRVRDTSINPIKDDPNNKNRFNMVVQLEVLGPDAGGCSTNAGRVHTQYSYIDRIALASPDSKVSGSYKRRVATINSLLAACGLDLSAGIPSYKAILGAEDQPDKALVGTTVYAVMRKFVTKKDPSTPQMDIDGYEPATTTEA